MSQETISQEKGTKTPFFEALFDLKFQNWVTLRVAGMMYLVTVSILGVYLFIAALVFVSETGGFLSYLLLILGFPLGFFFVALTLRLAFEGAVATVAIARNTESLRR
jgi:hypothetical protein